MEKEKDEDCDTERVSLDNIAWRLGCISEVLGQHEEHPPIFETLVRIAVALERIADGMDVATKPQIVFEPYDPKKQQSPGQVTGL